MRHRVGVEYKDRDTEMKMYIVEEEKVEKGICLLILQWQWQYEYECATLIQVFKPAFTKYLDIMLSPCVSVFVKL